MFRSFARLLAVVGAVVVSTVISSPAFALHSPQTGVAVCTVSPTPIGLGTVGSLIVPLPNNVQTIVFIEYEGGPTITLAAPNRGSFTMPFTALALGKVNFYVRSQSLAKLLSACSDTVQS